MADMTREELERIQFLLDNSGIILNHEIQAVVIFAREAFEGKKRIGALNEWWNLSAINTRLRLAEAVADAVVEWEDAFHEGNLLRNEAQKNGWPTKDWPEHLKEVYLKNKQRMDDAYIRKMQAVSDYLTANRKT